MKNRRRRPVHRVGYETVLQSRNGGQETRPGFELDFNAFQRDFAGDLPKRFVDFLQIGVAIHFVDRLIRRERGVSRSGWRHLKARVPVLDPVYWSRGEVLDSLQETVELVSDDTWEFEFIKTSSPYDPICSLPIDFSGEGSPLVCLYSGGLDSAAGLALRLAQCPGRSVLPITVKHQHRQHSLIKNQLELLKCRLKAKIEPVTLYVRPHGVQPKRREPSQRTRSFLFAAAGATAAAVVGGSSVEVYESGIGAINIPLMAGMNNSMATRGCHPEFLRRMSRLASIVVGREICFELPFRELTKGEMVQALNKLGLSNLAHATISCARYPRGVVPYMQCGFCPACVFRRQAMTVGGIEEPKGRYAVDLFGCAEEVNRIPDEKLVFLKAFLRQAVEWTKMEATGRLPESAELFLRSTQILGHGETPTGLMALLIRHRDEWLGIAEEMRPRGYGWANLLAPARAIAGGESHASA